MGKTCMLFMVIFSIAITTAHGGLTEDRYWIQNCLNQANPKVTQFQLYVQDILSGPNPTNIVVTSASSTPTSPTLFGLLSVLDDPVRTAPNPNATIVGRIQGSFIYSSLAELSLEMLFDLMFVGGAYNGSSLNVVGHNPYLRPRRELSIVGGSGVFRLAYGFIGIRTVFLNTTTGDAFFEYNITVAHCY